MIAADKMAEAVVLQTLDPAFGESSCGARVSELALRALGEKPVSLSDIDSHYIAGLNSKETSFLTISEFLTAHDLSVCPLEISLSEMFKCSGDRLAILHMDAGGQRASQHFALAIFHEGRVTLLDAPEIRTTRPSGEEELD